MISMVTTVAVLSATISVATSDSCAPFTIVKNIGLVNGAYLLKEVDNVTDVDACCTACQATATCAVFTYNPIRESCRMSTQQHASAHKVGDAVSGHIGPMPPPDPAPGPGPAPPSPAPPIPFPNYCTGKTCRNVLYLVADDMRSDWGTYGLPVKTPHFDALAAKSVLFEHAYCQISVCAPSRMSFMTGRRPDTYGVWNFIDTVPTNTSATPGHFRDHGYITLGLGKTFHQNSGAWNAEAYWSLDDQPYFPYESGRCPHGGEGGGHCMQQPDQIYDYHLRLQTIDYLNYAANKSKGTGKPFYVMAGFRKPHAPFQYTQETWDMYNDSDIALPTHKTLPPGTPLIAWSHQLSVEFANGTSFQYSPYSPVPDAAIRDTRHAYYAAISYVDQHVGAILDTLEATGMADNTLVLFHADHGYHMGEHGEWEKKSNFDLVVRVPLMIHAPWMPATWGARSPGLFDLVNVFPTVASLAGLPVPSGVDGLDLSVLVSNPNSTTAPAAAYHQYPACGCGDGAACFNQTRDACNNTPRNQFKFMGFSVRTAEWRYTTWMLWDNVTLTGEWDGPHADELYTHVGDHSYEMDRYEVENQAAANPDAVAMLRAQLRAFFEAHSDKTSSLRLGTVPASAAATPDRSDPYDV